MLVAEGVPDYPEPGRYWKLIEKHHVTWVELAPALIRGQMAHGDQKVLRYNLDSLRIVCTGGEPWTEKPWKWLFTNVGKNKVPIMNSAGGTEVSGSILLCCLHRPLKVGSFNAPIPGMGADIVNNRGQVVKAGEMGELVMRHSSIGLKKVYGKMMNVILKIIGTSSRICGYMETLQAEMKMVTGICMAVRMILSKSPASAWVRPRLKTSLCKPEKFRGSQWWESPIL